MLRAWRESLTEDPGKQERIAKQEEEYLKNAKEGFAQANIKEDYPLCGKEIPLPDFRPDIIIDLFIQMSASLHVTCRPHCAMIQFSITW